MDAGDIKDVAVKYWPWLLGGGIGIFLISRMGGGSSSGGYASYDPTLASLQATQGGYAAQIAGQQLQADSTRYVADVQKEISLAELEQRGREADAEYEMQMYRIDMDGMIKDSEIRGMQNIASIQTKGMIEQARITGQTTVAVAQIGAAVESVYAYADLTRAVNEPVIAGIYAARDENIAGINSLTALGLQTNELKYMAHRDTLHYGTEIFKSLAYNQGVTVDMFGPAIYPMNSTGVQRPNLDWLSDITKTAIMATTGAPA